MTYEKSTVWAIVGGVALAALLALFVVNGWISGEEEASAFGRWQAIMLVAAGTAFLVWFLNRGALEAGGAGSAASPALLLGTLALVSLPLFSLGLFAILAIPALNYAYINLSTVPVRSEGRKAWLGVAFSVIALVAGTVLCLVSSWRIWP